MKLLIEGKTTTNDPNAFSIEAGFLLKALKNEDGNLKKLKAGSRFYPYVDENGDISHLGCIFSGDPVGDELTNQAAFRSASQLAFIIDTPKSVFGTKEQQVLHEESMQLKGSRLYPAYLEIKKAQALTTAGVAYAFISGSFHRVRDRRLEFLAPDESTAFGSGTFTLDKVKALWNGGYLNLSLSPYAKKIEEIVSEQTGLLHRYSALYSDQDAGEERRRIASKYEHTKKLLKPHANEIYKYENDKVYYINKGGNWQSQDVPALRDLDAEDRQRIYRKIANTGRLTTNLRGTRARLHEKSFYDKTSLETLAPAFQPHVIKSKDSDLKALEDKKRKFESLTPLKGPLGAKDMPGLKAGVELFPHQALILGALKENPRMLIDADPGAGKTLVIICDILQQMKEGKVKRPLVLMPEDLLSQFAREVMDFSQLNPWIISTGSIKNWKDGELPAFIEDAKAAPANTVFMTSYHWISLQYNRVANGEVSEIEDEGEDGTLTKSIRYRTSKDFYRTRILLNELKIDGLWQDECHVLKGSSNQALAAVHLTSGVPVVRGLTGTVMPGNPFDVTGPMSVIHSGVFGTQEDFINDYTARGSIQEYKDEAPKQIRQKLRDFGMVSVRRSAWAHLMPKVRREYHFVEFTSEQKAAYTDLLAGVLKEVRKDPKLAKILEKFESEIDTGDLDMGNLLSRFAPLDIFLNSPSDAKHPSDNRGIHLLKSTMTGKNAISPKSKAINEIIRKHLASPEAGKVIVFGQYRDGEQNLLDHLDPDLQAQADYYEGGMIDVLNRFKNPQDPLKILFGVDKTLVVGHNMQAANCVIHADLRWLPGEMDQRESRVNRIKQARDVVFHYIMVKGSAEILKQARLLSIEHLVAKANSDFTDKKMLQPIGMTYHRMTTFHEEEKLKPYIERKKMIEEHYLEQAQKEKTFYGPSLLKPRGYAPISESVAEAKQLKKVPSAKDFIGDSRNHEALVEKELNELPDDPKHPKKLALGLLQRDGSWFLYSYKSADPTGFLRALSFRLQLGHYYIELVSKGEADSLVRRLEEKLTITNKEIFEEQVRTTRVLEHGIRKGLKKKSQKAKSVTSAKETEDKMGEVELQFGTFDGAPVIWVRNVFSADDPEVLILKRLGFEFEPPYWEKKISRSQLTLLLTKIKTYPKVRIADWEDFKDDASQAFRSLNLNEFDDLAG